jgi:site-specific DNA-methyltransferase (adenine-specific)
MKVLLHGDCLEQIKTFKDNSIDSIVTDPPYGLSFMGKKWDYDVPSVDVWKECLRVLKPGGHLLSFSGSRTYHRMAVRIEDAGFEIRDQIMWVYGSGFPKSHNIGKAVDKLQGNEREVVGEVKDGFNNWANFTDRDWKPENNVYTKGTSEWEGWGTALKPAHEPIVMARKPLSEKTVAENVLRWGTGGLNIDESRIEGLRWPANIMFDEEAGQVLDQQSGISGTGNKKIGKDRRAFFHEQNQIFSGGTKTSQRIEDYGDKGGASRFFYCPKTSKKDRDEGMNGFEYKSNFKYDETDKHSLSHLYEG